MYQKRTHLYRLLFCLLDCALATGVFLLSGLLRYGSFAEFQAIVDLPQGIVLTVLTITAFFYINAVYNDFVKRGYLVEFLKVVFFNLCVLSTLVLYTFATKSAGGLSRLTLLYFALINTLLQYGLHCLIKRLLRTKTKRRAALLQQVLLFVPVAKAEDTVRRVQQDALWDKVLSGIVLTDGGDAKSILGVPVVANMDTYLAYATAHVVDEVLLIPERVASAEDDAITRRVVLDFEEMGITTNVEIHTVDTGSQGVRQVYHYGSFHVVGFSPRFYDFRMLMVKRAMDIAGSVIGLLITAALGIIIVPCILLESRGPVFFAQKRVGKNGRTFTIYKFRSMRDGADLEKAALMAQNEMKGHIFKIKDDPRITRVGRFLRKTSLDEFPQFFNVLKGDMSLVGTRPPTPDEYAQYTHLHKRRLSFKPGITGLWQVSGRNRIDDFDEIVRLDVEYINTWSIPLDIKILLKTIVVVLLRRGAE